MHMPVAVGIVLAIIFLTAFSGWFYHLTQGWGQLVVDDAYYSYRIFGATCVTILVVCVTFFVMALVNECPNEERTGLMARLRCEEYLKIKAGTDKIFASKETKTEVVN